jgi:glutathione S-transferase
VAAVVLYGLSRSVYTRITRLALEEKGVGYTLEEVEIFGPDGAPPEHLGRHPFGRIPVLEHAGLVLYETGAVTRYVDEAFPGPVLQPTDAVARARMNQVISIVDAYAYRPIIWGVFINRVSNPREGRAVDQGAIGAALPRIRTVLRSLESISGAQRFFAGEQLSLADLHVAPVLLYFQLTVEGRKMIAEHARLDAWLAGMKERRSVQTTRSIYEAEAQHT